MLCNSGQNGKYHCDESTTSRLGLEVHEKASLCDMPHQLTSTHTHHKDTLAPFGRW